ncbi:hypothetical protein PCC6912_54440 [Chlorogloeopsis fritschii PCC 6912]|uniref:Uncharacterized protein n=2 Tax=Chlorogloeopsis fritschii TaxID=1124 RepID=A0A3S0XPC3_CHLFR|nr:hypothetical protein PCC6912_54440 [Chlorogloeopsis fritschii PCC 6912]
MTNLTIVFTMLSKYQMTIEELKTQIKRLNSKAGQMKMDLHDLAEGLPTDYEKLMDVATATYKIYCQLDELKQQLKQMEQKK